MTKAQLKELCLYAATGTVPANFQNGDVDVNAAVVDGFKELCPSINQFMKNRYDIYEIITETVDEVVPTNVINAVSMFAEVKQVPQGQKARFVIRNKLGRERAKQFLTQVGLSGVYETFRLDTDSFEVAAHAVGGAARVDFERILDGADNLQELMAIITEGLENAAYIEIHRALVSAIDTLSGSTKNKYAANGFDGDKMASIINTVKSYGKGAAIFATPDFIVAMGPDVILPTYLRNPVIGQVHTSPVQDDIDAIHNTGRIRIFRGTPIVEIPQSYTDDKHNTTYIDDSIAYILPTGGEKLVKLVFEGNTQIYDAVNRDNSLEVNIYKKLGAAVMTRPDWGVYRNLALIPDGFTPVPTSDWPTTNPKYDPSFNYGF